MPKKRLRGDVCSPGKSYDNDNPEGNKMERQDKKSFVMRFFNKRQQKMLSKKVIIKSP